MKSCKLHTTHQLSLGTRSSTKKTSEASTLAGACLLLHNNPGKVTYACVALVLAPITGDRGACRHEPLMH